VRSRASGGNGSVGMRSCASGGDRSRNVKAAKGNIETHHAHHAGRAGAHATDPTGSAQN
jgi:hypothetical protein